jgi:hypothetical protein
MDLKSRINYLLEHMSDKDKFEDYSTLYFMLVHGQKDIKSVSGTNDGGKDAIRYVDKAIYAYSTEKGWKKKLNKDAKRVDSTRATSYVDGIEKFYFVTTDDVKTYYKEKKEHKEKYNWELEVIGLRNLTNAALAHSELRSLLGVSTDEDYKKEGGAAIEDIDISLVESAGEVIQTGKEEIELFFKENEIGSRKYSRFKLKNKSNKKIVINNIIQQVNYPYPAGENWEPLQSRGTSTNHDLDMRYKYIHFDNHEVLSGNELDIFVELPVMALNTIYNTNILFEIKVTVPKEELDYITDVMRYKKVTFFTKWIKTN